MRTVLFSRFKANRLVLFRNWETVRAQASDTLGLDYDVSFGLVGANGLVRFPATVEMAMRRQASLTLGFDRHVPFCLVGARGFGAFVAHCSFAMRAQAGIAGRLFFVVTDTRFIVGERCAYERIRCADLRRGNGRAKDERRRRRSGEGRREGEPFNSDHKIS